MEDHKLRYLHLLLRRKKERVEKYISGIEHRERDARMCYGDPISLSSTEFLEMLVLDGCFILELVRKYYKIIKMWEKQSEESRRQEKQSGESRRREKQSGESREDHSILEQDDDSLENDLIFSMKWIIDSLQRDLMLFENQVPFFILHDLFHLIGEAWDLKLYFWIFFNNHPGGAPFNLKFPDCVIDLDFTSGNVKHLLDLVHRFWFPQKNDKKFRHITGMGCFRASHPRREEMKMEKRRFIVRATALKETNVKFKKCPSDTVFNIKFKNGTILMPQLVIKHRAEPMFRNLIVYEQYFGNPEVNYVTDYVKFLDCLIDSPKDVEILIRSEIVDNRLGDDEGVAKIVNRLVDSAAGPSSHILYAETYKNVNKHCKKPMNRWTVIFRRNYWNSPWAAISIIGAVVLLLLTVTQTVCSLLQVA